MSTVLSALNRKGVLPVTISPGATVMDALKIMEEKNIGSVVVMQNEEYLGIMTERDYSRKVILKNKDSAPVSYTHLRAHETVLDLVCRLLLEKNNQST